MTVFQGRNKKCLKKKSHCNITFVYCVYEFVLFACLQEANTLAFGLNNNGTVTFIFPMGQ